MGVGVSLFLIAVGAILTWGVSADVEGLDINVIGVILMIIGLVGFLLSLLFWSSWGGPRYFRRATYTEPGVTYDRWGRRRTTYVEEEAPPAPPGEPPPPP
jgi:Domain of unknown function (DUF6458)